MPKIVAFTKKFTNGRTGDLGQYVSSDEQYVKDSVNLVSNRSGQLTNCAGTKSIIELDIQQNDKVVPFSFGGRQYFLIYDPLLYRRFRGWDGKVSDYWPRPNYFSNPVRGLSERDESFKTNFIYLDHFQVLANFGQPSFGAVDSNEVLRRKNRRYINVSTNATTRYRTVKTERTDSYRDVGRRFHDVFVNHSNNLQDFLDNTHGLREEITTSTGWYQRFLIVDENGDVVAKNCLRPLMVEHESIDRPAEISDWGDVLKDDATFKELITDPINVRNKVFGKGLGEYRAVVRPDDVIFYDKEGLLPTIRWGYHYIDTNTLDEDVIEFFTLQDIRCLNNFRIPNAWWVPPLTQKEYDSYESRISDFLKNEDFFEEGEYIQQYDIVDTGAETGKSTTDAVKVKGGKHNDSDVEEFLKESDVYVDKKYSPFTRIQKKASSQTKVGGDTFRKSQLDYSGIRYYEVDNYGSTERNVVCTFNGSPIYEMIEGSKPLTARKYYTRSFLNNVTRDGYITTKGLFVTFDFYFGPKNMYLHRGNALFGGASGGAENAFISQGPQVEVMIQYKLTVYKDVETVNVPGDFSLPYFFTVQSSPRLLKNSATIAVDFVYFYNVLSMSESATTSRRLELRGTVKNPNVERLYKRLMRVGGTGHTPFNTELFIPTSKTKSDGLSPVLLERKVFIPYSFYLALQLPVEMPDVYGTAHLTTNKTPVGNSFFTWGVGNRQFISELVAFTNRLYRLSGYVENRPFFSNYLDKPSETNGGILSGSGEANGILKSMSLFLQRIAKDNLFNNLKDRLNKPDDDSVDPIADDSFFYTPQNVQGIEILWILKTFGEKGKVTFGTNQGEIVSNAFNPIELANATLNRDIPVSSLLPVDILDDRYYVESGTGEVLYSRFHFQYSGRRQYSTTGHFNDEIQALGGIRKILGFQKTGFCVFLVGGVIFSCLVTQNTDFRGWFKLELDKPIDDIYEINGELYCLLGKEIIKWGIYSTEKYNIDVEPYFSPLDSDIFVSRSQTDRLEGISDFTSAKGEVKGDFSKVKPYFRVPGKGATTSLVPRGRTLLVSAQASGDGVSTSIGFAAKKDKNGKKLPIDVTIGQYRLVVG